ncbi:MAG TPA: peptidoglycan editing factor PgeF [Nocardioidaceae bacterium]|nr:peptidoglycan editing factor PgeF [Nocardioidaceae bacterium]
MEVAFTDRHGGVSGGSFASLNLALVGGDDPEAVEENHRRVGAEFNGGGPLLGMFQVHGPDVAVVEDQPGTALPECDGLVATTPGSALLVRVADCVPILLADPDAGVVGAVHAGRQGLAVGVLPATLDRMRGLGARRITAWVGPHICGRCYEVPQQLQDEVAAIVPESRATTSWGTPSLDLGAGVRAQLATVGAEVVTVDRCTREDADLYSFRRDGAEAGRLGGLVRLRP